MRPTMIRPTIPADHAILIDLTQRTGKFKPEEIVALGEVLVDYELTNKAHGHVSVTYEANGQIVGFAYYAPAAMTDRTWYLYWIAVETGTQAKGIGGKLLKAVEEDIHQRHGRHLLIETSSLPHYELTRKFYSKHNYELHAIIGDYYADGDNMVIFRKRFTP